MSSPAAEPRTLVIERVLPHSPKKIWRALTETDLLAQWIWSNDFEATPGRPFQFRTDPMPPHWNGIVDGEVRDVEPERKLVYTWASGGIEFLVEWTLAEGAGGTAVRMQLSGSPELPEQAWAGATYGWQRFYGQLEQFAPTLD